MSIARLHDVRQMIDSLGQGAPFAWVIVANPVWGRCEDRNLIAIFDTKEEAEAYEHASRLPQVSKTEDGIGRSYRPDSLLYDYNPDIGGDISRMVQPVTNPMFGWTCCENPVPPDGPAPPMRLLDHPKYGTDYDVGFGPGSAGYTDNSREVPRLL